MSRQLSPEGALVHPGCNIRDSMLGAYTEIGAGSVMLNSTIGAYSYCARGCDIANADIGKFVNIAANVRIGPTDHPMDRASLHHFLYRSDMYWPDETPDAAFFERRAARRVRIGHDVWIGHGAIIRPDVSIGHGAVVGAGAVVTRDVAPYTIVVGVPAEKLRRRFPKQIARRLTELAWWDWDHDRLRMALSDFRNLEIGEFLAKYDQVTLH
ncbi:DapH/DapD/GlmU-related protein [Roseinatronobacter alkalisoli]|uniref:DapH/DapD/GlmU-related protein n=1 Tax=Roseinatronobacter alkalisoli TaxID=3028235 RepID=A0ABT5T6I3_9RHOB|nr:DapH/DapD/GlmU-related protein [Roseinatronobacter sp. HJB301]MDD7970659.1 DapH/DapD/GlmU-related protein [Roseinatronobacter sp. HJB301]